MVPVGGAAGEAADVAGARGRRLAARRGGARRHAQTVHGGALRQPPGQTVYGKILYNIINL